MLRIGANRIPPSLQNPSLGLSCDLKKEHSYCIEGPTTTIADPTTIDPVPEPSDAGPLPPDEEEPQENDNGNEDNPPTPTKPDNGIDTPLPIQEGMVDDCDAFYPVEAGDTCAVIASGNGVDVSDIISWNPAVGPACGNMWEGYNLCVSVIGHEAAPAAPDNGVETPTPIQPGMVDNCNEFYLVKTGDVCKTISDENNITLDQFLEWNTGVGGRGCPGLWGDAYVCIGVID